MIIDKEYLYMYKQFVFRKNAMPSITVCGTVNLAFNHNWLCYQFRMSMAFHRQLCVAVSNLNYSLQADCPAVLVDSTAKGRPHRRQQADSRAPSSGALHRNSGARSRSRLGPVARGVRGWAHSGRAGVAGGTPGAGRPPLLASVVLRLRVPEVSVSRQRWQSPE